ncbi:hypothetical protein GCM10011581_40060 [Saccharopolyspora subtropica]|uniref:DUF1990 domain-containing protein n=1 Tax=Saccharopolyspora thermophila TaxID=89367 RepID=A0A917K2Y1_9PSEU|nr:DUF1990 family protein [Saccharopolyspora subtropica]GGI98828.1 hypothetical protein GCM10011581_40060 [Saccharopolyspora subtropica]
MSGPATGFAGVDVARRLAQLRGREVNYTADEVGGPAWRFDRWSTRLPAESPGPPEPGRAWETACRLVRHYEFSAPDIVRAAYDADEPLLGRTMLLEGRFSGMRFYVGVRVTGVVDRQDAGRRVWGWSYETLHGHLERGRISYEVVKDENTGEVEFVIDAYSQRAPTLGPALRLGWALFGRQRQLHYYRECGRRMRRFSDRPPPAPEPRTGLVVAPSDARAHPLDRFVLRNIDPG